MCVRALCHVQPLSHLHASRQQGGSLHEQLCPASQPCAGKDLRDLLWKVTQWTPARIDEQVEALKRALEAVVASKGNGWKLTTRFEAWYREILEDLVVPVPVFKDAANDLTVCLLHLLKETKHSLGGWGCWACTQRW